MGRALAAIINFTQNLASAALSFSCVINPTNLGFSNRTWELTEVLIGFSVANSETIKVTYISAIGANYSILLDSTTLSSFSNYVFRPVTPIICMPGDTILVTCTNAAMTGIAYGIMKFKPASGD